MLALLLSLACTCAAPDTPSAEADKPGVIDPSASQPAEEAPPEPPPTCFGPEGATRGLIYLHGADSSPSSPKEVFNHRMMMKLARELQIRVAAPRATALCQDSSDTRCWGTDLKREEAEAGLAAVKAAQESCLGDRPFEILGFSNGGLLAQALVQHCLPHGAARLTSVATSGFWDEAEGSTLAGCGDLTVLMPQNNEDNLKRAEAFVAHLTKRGAAAQLREFHGGHELKPSPIFSALATPLPAVETPSPSD